MVVDATAHRRCVDMTPEALWIGITTTVLAATWRPRPRRSFAARRHRRSTPFRRRVRRTPESRWARRRRARSVDRLLPDVIDLFVLTVHAGFLPRDAFRLLAPVVDPFIGDAFDEVLDRVDRGQRFPDALAALPERLGPSALTFADTLAGAERTGLPVTASLGRLADDARHHRRRSAEAAARELPVRLSFPLVLCTLPSFVLVAIVPLLLGTLSAIDPPG
jgi:Flp pilus assembly protein TadB